MRTRLNNNGITLNLDITSPKLKSANKYDIEKLDDKLDLILLILNNEKCDNCNRKYICEFPDGSKLCAKCIENKHNGDE